MYPLHLPLAQMPSSFVEELLPQLQTVRRRDHQLGREAIHVVRDQPLVVLLHQPGDSAHRLAEQRRGVRGAEQDAAHRHDSAPGTGQEDLVRLPEDLVHELRLDHSVPEGAEDLDRPAPRDAGEDRIVELRRVDRVPHDDEDVLPGTFGHESIEVELQHLVGIVQLLAPTLELAAHHVVCGAFHRREAAPLVRAAERVGAGSPQGDTGLGARTQVGILLPFGDHPDGAIPGGDAGLAGAFEDARAQVARHARREARDVADAGLVQGRHELVLRQLAGVTEDVDLDARADQPGVMFQRKVDAPDTVHAAVFLHALDGAGGVVESVH